MGGEPGDLWGSNDILTDVGMRVQIPDNLKARMEDVVDEAGYNSLSDLAREGIRQRLDELEEREMRLDDDR